MRWNPNIVTTDQATRLLQRWWNPSLNVTATRKLHGGMIHHVCEWFTDGEPASVVAKLNTSEHASALRREMLSLNWYRTHTELPVPEPYAFIEETDQPISGLIMQRIAGTNLADARLSPRGVERFQVQLAQHLIRLHHHRRDAFGPAERKEGATRWLDVFGQGLQREFEAVRDVLPSCVRTIVAELIHHLDRWLTDLAPPTLVHGDLWATNILVDDSHPDRPQIQAFIDCEAFYCDPEYELAYLRLFRTADDTFFRTYTRHHPLRPGFDRRCRVYWLNTMLLHVRLFGERYLSTCEDLARQIRQLK